MSDVDTAQLAQQISILLKDMGRVEGRVDGHDTRLDQAHADIKDLRAAIDGVRTDMVAGHKEIMSTVANCIGAQETRLKGIIEQANTDQSKLFEAHLAAVASGGQIDLKQVLAKPSVAWIGGGGIATLGIAILDYLQKHA